MDRVIYLAPLEGITDNIYRNTFMKYYGGVTKCFTPFLSPNSTRKFTTKEFNNVDPEKNDLSTTVPQLLTNSSEHFLWAVEKLVDMGYREINFNLGCPSGTVVAKKKGSGLLYYPKLLDQTLYEIFDGLGSYGSAAPAISIKTRLGKNDPQEFMDILDIYNKYPISQLTIHPRIQTDFYKLPVRPEYFDYAMENTDIPLVYNGDLKTPAHIDECFNAYPDIDAVMLGRGLIATPGMLVESSFDKTKFWSFHDSLLAQYKDLLSGETPLLHRLKEFWVFWQENFPDSAKALKAIRKSKSLAEYTAAIGPLK